MILPQKASISLMYASTCICAVNVGPYFGRHQWLTSSCSLAISGHTLRIVSSDQAENFQLSSS